MAVFKKRGLGELKMFFNRLTLKASEFQTRSAGFSQVAYLFGESLLSKTPIWLSWLTLTEPFWNLQIGSFRRRSPLRITLLRKTTTRATRVVVKLPFFGQCFPMPTSLASGSNKLGWPIFFQGFFSLKLGSHFLYRIHLLFSFQVLCMKNFERNFLQELGSVPKGTQKGQLLSFELVWSSRKTWR